MYLYKKRNCAFKKCQPKEKFIFLEINQEFCQFSANLEHIYAKEKVYLKISAARKVGVSTISRQFSRFSTK